MTYVSQELPLLGQPLIQGQLLLANTSQPWLRTYEGAIVHN